MRRPRKGQERTQGKWCFYCGAELVFDKKQRVFQPALATIDHLTPKCRGGIATAENSVEACYSCNAAKRELTLDEYRFLIAYRTGKICTGSIPGATVVLTDEVKFWGEQ